MFAVGSNSRVVEVGKAEPLRFCWFTRVPCLLATRNLSIRPSPPTQSIRNRNPARSPCIALVLIVVAACGSAFGVGGGCGPGPQRQRPHSRRRRLNRRTLVLRSATRGDVGGGGVRIEVGNKHYVPDTSPASRRLKRWLFDVAGCEGRGSTDLGYKATASGLCEEGKRLRGMFATEDHDEGEYLFAIPTNAAIAIEEEETNDAERGLILHEMLQDRAQREEAWGAYFDALPTLEDSFSPTPDFWSDGAIEALEVPRAVHAAKERRRRIKSLADREGIGLEELRFATWLVESRSFNVLRDVDDAEWRDDEWGKEEEEESDGRNEFNHGDRRDEDDNEDMTDNEEIPMHWNDDVDMPLTKCLMVPYLDMVNHSSDDPNAEIQVLSSSSSDDTGGEAVDYFGVVATRYISAGDEVTISYGTGSDSSIDLLLHYGFVPNTNLSDIEMYECSEENSENDLFCKEEDFSTTLEDDLERLGNDLSLGEEERVVLQFRVRMKSALREWNQYLVADG